MQYNILEYLEKTVKRVPEKLAYADENSGLTFKEVSDQARAIGTFISKEGLNKEPLVVFMKRQPATISAFYGVVYSGNYYVPIDEEMPRYRIEMILKNLKPKAIICDETAKEIMTNIAFEGQVYDFDEIIKTEVEEKRLDDIRDKALDIDPIYVVFTSGSTGSPKGVVACHRSVIDYIENLSEVLAFDENSVFGNQSPLYFDACLKEIYSTMKFGGTTYMIPKQLFMFPMKLVDFLNEKKINTVCWVVSALTMISAFKVLETNVPKYLHTVAFGSEVFPIKQFNLWKKALPNARFVNLYGPTEATGMSCYYEANREFNEDEVIPIGKPFRNTEIILIDEHQMTPKQGELGEICIRGTAVTLGYYEDFEKTNEVFVQNPLNKAFAELVYKTGDLAKIDEHGDLIFVSRKDYQIKHMGHRIELGEIESNVNQILGIKAACCIYPKEKKKIVLFYVGDLKASDITAQLKEKLPRYMIPNIIKNLEAMPLTPNGKIDRVLLNEKLIKKEKK